VTPATSLASTVAALRTLIGADSAWTIVTAGTSQIKVKRVDTATFTAQFQQEGLSPVGRVTISGKPDATTQAAARWTSATIDVTAAHNNETLNIVVNGVTYPATGSTNVSTLISRITTALSGLSSSGITVSSTSSTVSLSSAAGFTLSYSVTAAASTGSITLANTTWAAANLQLDIVSGQSFSSSDTYQITVNSTPYSATGASLTAVGNNLRDQLNSTGQYTATYDSTTRQLTIRKAGSTTPTVSSKVTAAVQGAGTITTQNGAGTTKLAIGGTIVAGEIWRVVVGSVTLADYTAQPGDTTATVAAAIAALIPVGSDYTASVTGSTITFDNTNSLLSPSVSCTIVPAASGDATITTLGATSGHGITATLGGTVTTDEVWTLNLTGNSAAVYTVTGSSITRDDIGASLVTSINASGLYKASYASNVLSIVRLDTTAITATQSVVMPVSAPLNMSAGTLHEDWSTAVGTLDTFVADDVFTLQLTTNGTLTTKTYTVASGDDATAVLSGD
jgi:hypothetical protein